MKGGGGGLVGWSGGETFPTCAKDGKFILYFLQSKWITQIKVQLF